MFVEYPVLYEKPEEVVAQYKFTALLLPSGNVARTTGGEQLQEDEPQPQPQPQPQP